MTERSKTEPRPRPYEAPRVTRYGSVGTLAATGSQGGPEGVGVGNKDKKA